MKNEKSDTVTKKTFITVMILTAIGAAVLAVLTAILLKMFVL